MIQKESKNLTNIARILRKNMTDAERKLWKHLRNKQVNGCKFRRQQPVGPYIVDFLCYENKLIIEADGGQHAINIEKDFLRTKFLNENGYQVIRFWNNEVLLNISGVLEVIYEECSKI